MGTWSMGHGVQVRLRLHTMLDDTRKQQCWSAKFQARHLDRNTICAIPNAKSEPVSGHDLISACLHAILCIILCNPEMRKQFALG